MNDVRSADRTLAIFECFEAMGHQMPLREIATHCGVPVSTCHALVRTLVRRGYMYTIGRRKELYPSRRLAQMGEAIAARDPYLVRMGAVLEELRARTGETVIVGKRQGDALIYLQVLEAPSAIRYYARPGDYRPLHTTAGGKALLSLMNEDELVRWLDAHPLAQVTPRTITDPKQLLQEIEWGRAHGYFTATGESTADAAGVAVTVDMEMEVLALFVVGPAERIGQRRAEHAQRLLDAKQSLQSSNHQVRGRSASR